MKDNLNIKDEIFVKKISKKEDKMTPEIKLKANVLIERRTKDGKVLDKEELHNLIVSVGKERVAKLINGVSTTYFRAIAIGIGTNAPADTDTSLQSEYTRALATTSYEAGNKAVFEHTFSFTEAVSITEAGIFDSDSVSGSTMLNRFTFSAKNVDVDTNLYVKVTITVG